MTGESCNFDCSACALECGKRTQEKADFTVAQNEMSHVKRVVGVVSGKGGVGKSMVTSLLAVLMRRAGYRVAILDADITGPSIPTAFGLKEKAAGNEYGLFPARTKTGISVMSLNLLLENKSDPVVWRGPIIANVIKQFWADVMWGTVDLMLIDMPPGTGDVPLTVFQSIAVDGVIVVTSPQQLVSMIVGKAANMARMMGIPMLALIENMGYIECPHCGERVYPFGPSRLDSVAHEHGIKAHAALPIDPKLAEACDKGMIELFDGDWLSDIAVMLEGLIDREDEPDEAGEGRQ